jgi:hypothetical protein
VKFKEIPTQQRERLLRPRAPKEAPHSPLPSHLPKFLSVSSSASERQEKTEEIQVSDTVR